MANDSKPSSDTGRYAARGVSASKNEVHAAVDKLDRGLFPGAFCKITEDHTAPPFSASVRMLRSL